jgi:transposase
MPQLIRLFNISRKTLYNWLTRWEDERLIGLYDRIGKGRKPKLDQDQKQQIKEWVKKNPKNLKKVLNEVQEEWGVSISKETIKRIVKKFAMLWKRMKRGLAGKPEEWEFEVKLEKLNQLKEQEKKGEIELRYLDEAGFSLTPSIPYAWQEKGSRIILNSQKSQRLNILGMLNIRNELAYEVYVGNTTSEHIIKFLDKFSEKLKIKTVVVLDQASIHTSDQIIKKLEDWKEKNLEIFWLPTYSPQLNLIEILWKFMKYEWIEVDAYKNWKSLVNYVKKVLKNVGDEYVINFA